MYSFPFGTLWGMFKPYLQINFQLIWVVGSELKMCMGVFIIWKNDKWKGEKGIKIEKKWELKKKKKKIR